ncbi:MAG: phosphoribosylamine--glycine ligase [Armatimonadetes bacterium]|nr:phosphoribosylamine--glycine ligase [Armatimonadota bacterium]
MNALLVGGGGREHALAWKMAQSPSLTRLYAAPGNAGMASCADLLSARATDLPALTEFAEKKRIDLAVVGPESPLIAGLADALLSRGTRVFGPTQAAAALEGSKVFSKELMAKYNIPTPPFQVFDEAGRARAYLESLPDGPVVVKADGEAAGKGVYVCKSRAEAQQAVSAIMEDHIFGESGNWIVIEERLVGEEASLMAFVDGETIVPMIPSQDHKRALDNDEGPNTGGMGCYAPVPSVTPQVFEEALNRIVRPAVRAMIAEGRPYRGCLYAGIMMTDRGLSTLEFNCRFGDPETQVVLPLLQNDLLEIFQATAEGRLAEIEVSWADRKSVCVVLASGGYPGGYKNGETIEGLEEASRLPDVTVFHAGTARQGDRFVTAGGRVLGVTGMGHTFQEAIDAAYRGVRAIRFDRMHYRTDIARRVAGR